jgi:hypothetical protein
MCIDIFSSQLMCVMLWAIIAPFVNNGTKNVLWWCFHRKLPKWFGNWCLGYHLATIGMWSSQRALLWSKEGLFGVNVKRCELVLATILEQPWHFSQWDLIIVSNIQARIFIFDVTWEGILNRWFNGGWAKWALWRSFMDMKSQGH